MAPEVEAHVLAAMERELKMEIKDVKVGDVIELDEDEKAFVKALFEECNSLLKLIGDLQKARENIQENAWKCIFARWPELEGFDLRVKGCEKLIVLRRKPE